MEEGKKLDTPLSASSVEDRRYIAARRRLPVPLSSTASLLSSEWSYAEAGRGYPTATAIPRQMKAVCHQNMVKIMMTIPPAPATARGRCTCPAMRARGRGRPAREEFGSFVSYAAI